MYEDEPQDRVHDVLAEAIFGDHPLGRRVLGEAEVIGSIPVPDIAAYHRARYTGANIVVAAAGNLEHDADRRARRAAAVEPPAASGDGGARRRRGSTAPRLALPPEGHRAVPHLLRRPGHRPRRRAPLRARRPRRDLRRLDLLAAVPRGPREARPRLLGRLLHASSSPTAAWSPSTSAPARTTSRRPARSSAASSRRSATERRHRRGAGRAPRSTSRAAWCSPRSRPARG